MSYSSKGTGVMYNIKKDKSFLIITKFARRKGPPTHSIVHDMNYLMCIEVKMVFWRVALLHSQYKIFSDVEL